MESYLLIANQLYLNNERQKLKNSGNLHIEKAIHSLKIFNKSSERRNKHVEQKINESYQSFLALFRERTEPMVPEQQGESPLTLTETQPDAEIQITEKKSQKSKKKKKGGGGKKKGKKPTQQRSVTKSIVEEQTPDDDTQSIDNITIAPAYSDNIIDSSVQKEEVKLEKEVKLEMTEDENYVYDPAAQQEEFRRFAEAKKNQQNAEEHHKKTSLYPVNPYLTQDVTQKFLDIFGNKEGDVRKKQANASLYQRKGWGTIENLKETLARAGWLNNQKETETGIQKEKHKSSTISFRMPNSFKNMTAPVLKFHDDHGVSSQDMREITRYFIRESLEYFGYSEGFLLEYYKENFEKK